MPKRLNVILDIDNTFLEHTDSKHGTWSALTDAERAKYEFVASKHDPLSGFILRPGFVEFFTALSQLCKTVNLWTWSDCEYADGVKQLIESRTPCKITHVWCDEDAYAAHEMKGGHGKNLNYIWYTKKKFAPCDTILVDDLESNVHNGANYQNGIRLKKFALWSRVTKKTAFGPYTDMSADDTLMKVVDQLRKIDAQEGLCDDDEKPPLEDVEVVGGRKKKTRRARRRTLKRKFHGKTARYVS